MPGIRLIHGMFALIVLLALAQPAGAQEGETDGAAEAEADVEVDAEGGADADANGADDRPLLQPIDDLDDRSRRIGGPYFNRAPVRSYVATMARWSAQVDGPAFGQISFEFWSEFSPLEIEEMPFSFVALWGVSIGYSDAPSGTGPFQTIQPVYLGAKLNVLREDNEYFVSAMTIIGFIDDTVAGEYNPMNLLPGLRDFYWAISGMATYILDAADLAFNLEAVLQFNFGFPSDKVSFSVLLEAVYLLVEDITLRAGFDFHTVRSGANIFIQGDFWTSDALMFFAQFKGFLSGSGRVFDFALMGGVNLHFT